MKEIEMKLMPLEPIILEIRDDTNKHADHFSVIPGVISHASIKIVSNQFKGLTKIERHKMVYSLLQEDLRSSIHALSLNTLTFEEYNSGK